MQSNSKIQLPVVVHERDNSYIVECPFFEGCKVQAENFDEALENIRDVIKTCIRDGKNYRTKKFCTIKKCQFRTVKIDDVSHL